MSGYNMNRKGKITAGICLITVLALLFSYLFPRLSMVAGLARFSVFFPSLILIITWRTGLNQVELIPGLCIINSIFLVISAICALIVIHIICVLAIEPMPDIANIYVFSITTLGIGFLTGLLYDEVDI